MATASKTASKTDRRWLSAALAYLPKWLSFQMERYRQTGCSLAIVQGSKVIERLAFGVADLSTGEALTTGHRFRIASHSKTFTATAVMLLREQGKVGLDDSIGRYVTGLHKDLAKARVSELLSHSAGVIRDGVDSGQFADRRPYLSRPELIEALSRKQPLLPGLQLKYSNHGYGLLGMMIEAITGQSYSGWISKNVIGAAGLQETVCDWPFLPKSAAVARGHSAEFPFVQRLIVAGDNVCDAIAPAAGFVATASDVARFFAQLAPDNKASVLSAASRREMLQRRWRDNCNAQESHYGFGLMMNAPGPKEFWGHTGGFQGFVSRTAHFPSLDMTLSVLCNAQDGMSYDWVDGIASILWAFRQYGAPGKRHADWDGRWWSMWGATDLVAMGDALRQVSPAMTRPFDDSNSELVLIGKDHGTIRRASAYNSPAQDVRRVRDSKGKVIELWWGGGRLTSRQDMLAEVNTRYTKSKFVQYPQ